MILSTALKTGLRAGIVALALGGTALVAAPVQAASPSFGFQLNFGGPGPSNGIILQFGDDNYFDSCLDNRQIRSALRSKGYSQVKIVKESNSSNKVWAIGRKYGDWWQMRVDRCTRKVDRVEQIYPDGPDNSFNLTFTF